MHAPLFWKEKTLSSSLLLPAAGIYGWLAGRWQRNTQPRKLSIPVICIGNLVAGGSGKTPVALALGAMLKSRGIHAHFLSRGYKGTLKGPVRVEAHHSAREVGDEPLLLAEVLPTWVSKDKLAGALAAQEAGAQMIVMDDGFQNPVLHKDVSFLVIDGEYGFGNGRLIPAGPLRETVAAAMKRASAVILIGEDSSRVIAQVPPGKPVFRAQFTPLSQADSIRGKAVVAFAGIARPRKFYRTLQQLECSIRKMVAYPDHYRFKPGDMAFLREKAKEHEAVLVTTAKDYARLPASARAEVVAVSIEAVFEDGAAVLRMALAHD